MCTQSHDPIFACQSRCAQGTVLGPVLSTIMVNDISPTSQNTVMTKYADDITCSTPVGPKFLGVLVDQHLSWKPHIDFVSKKISKSVGIIANDKNFESRFDDSLIIFKF